MSPRCSVEQPTKPRTTIIENAKRIVAIECKPNPTDFNQHRDFEATFCGLKRKAFTLDRQSLAVTNARFASLHGLPVALSPSRRRPLRFTNRALVTSLHGAGPQERRASVCDSAAGVALRLRFARRSSPSFAPLSPLADRRPKPQLDFPRAIRRSSTCRSSNSRVCATSAANTDSFGSAVRYSRTSNLLPKPSIA